MKTMSIYTKTYTILKIEKSDDDFATTQDFPPKCNTFVLIYAYLCSNTSIISVVVS